MSVAFAVGGEFLRAVGFAARMGWQILWALLLGLTLSGIVQAVVSKREMRRLLPDDSPRTLVVATGLGAASSSCSYAAVALARSLVRRGADFTAAIVFAFASTNLVFELAIAIAVLLGWQFVLGEFVGGPVMIVLIAVIFRAFLPARLVEEARAQTARGRTGPMEGHAAMDMSAGGEGSWWQRLRTPAGLTAAADSFVMDWAAIGRDVAAGLLIAGALAAWVPGGFWRGLFLVHHPGLARVWGPLVAPLAAMISFVCSVGNVPLAAVLWNEGISFGGVVTFIFADLLILPILNVYRRYYGGRMAVFLLVSFYVAMVVAGLVVEFLFAGLGVEPARRQARVLDPTVGWNATTFLNIVFLVSSALLVVRYFRRGGGLRMLRMMGASAHGEADHAHHGETAHGGG